MIGYIYTTQEMSELAELAVRHNFLEYTELMLFLLVAMTYIIDATGEEVLHHLAKHLKSVGVELYIARAKKQLMDVFYRAGLVKSR